MLKILSIFFVNPKSGRLPHCGPVGPDLYHLPGCGWKIGDVDRLRAALDPELRFLRDIAVIDAKPTQGVSSAEAGLLRIRALSDRDYGCFP
jgi:hypothetical protein